VLAAVPVKVAHVSAGSITSGRLRSNAGDIEAHRTAAEQLSAGERPPRARIS